MSIFDQTLNRRCTNSVKWDTMETVYELSDTTDILPMWIADMDFAPPSAVSKALQKHAEEAIFGYSYVGEEAKQAIVDWQKKTIQLAY